MNDVRNAVKNNIYLFKKVYAMALQIKYAGIHHKLKYADIF